MLNHKAFLSVLVAIFIISLIGTAIAFRVTEQVVEEQARAVFSQETAAIQDLIQRQMNLYIVSLRSMAAFFGLSKEVTKEEWSSYIRELNLLKYYQGVSSFVFVERVKAKDKNAFIKNYFAIYPDEAKEEYYAVKYVEPLKDREASLGFDMRSEPKRLKAFELARDTGEPTATGLITLATTGKPGFLIILPLYDKDKTLNTRQERREVLKGFIMAVFREEEIFTTLFGKNGLFTNIDFEVYNGKELNQQNLLYDYNPKNSTLKPIRKAKFSSIKTIPIDGGVWTISITADPEFVIKPSQQRLPLIVLISGVTLNTLIFLFFLYRLIQHVRYVHGKKQ